MYQQLWNEYQNLKHARTKIIKSTQNALKKMQEVYNQQKQAYCKLLQNNFQHNQHKNRNEGHQYQNQFISQNYIQQYSKNKPHKLTKYTQQTQHTKRYKNKTHNNQQIENQRKTQNQQFYKYITTPNQTQLADQVKSKRRMITQYDKIYSQNLITIEDQQDDNRQRSPYFKQYNSNKSIPKNIKNQDKIGKSKSYKNLKPTNNNSG